MVKPGRVRGNLQESLQTRPALRHFPARVRRPALGIVRTARRYTTRQVCRSRTRIDQEGRARAGRRTAQPDRRCKPLLPARAAWTVDTMRVRVGNQGQSNRRADAGKETEVGGRGCGARVEVRRSVHKRLSRARRPKVAGACSRSCVSVLELRWRWSGERRVDRKSTRLNSSHMSISYAVFCLK